MKKIMTMALLAILILGACEKEDSPKATYQQSPNRVIVVPNSGKTGISTLLLAISIGHPAEGCNGCVLEDGKFIHINCMGEGNYCATSAAVQFQINGPVFSATTTDTFDLTSEDFFLMPDRSLDYMDDKGNPIYLNIPAQMVYRDSTTLQFTFTGLFFSTSPAYEND
ncbi:MAG: hypothetical protein IKQ20_09830 [Bacteroidales bacterium]|nr:hypothetical protein [Bacteroidales bacterium]